MSNTNIFQGRNGITDVIYEVLGYEKNENMSCSITRDIYFESYFYLCNRFGTPRIFDDYKKINIWNFKVKNYVISIELNSSWVTFIIYGKISKNKFMSKNNFQNYFVRSPYWVRYWRESIKNKSKLIDLMAEKKSKKDLKIIENLWNKFFDENGLESDEWTDERFEKEKKREWFKYLENYNTQIINPDSFSHLHEIKNYSNSKTKHALKTLRQFLNNMLTPISVRDCGFNIKGRISDSDYKNCEKFENNIKIEFIKSNRF